MNNQDKSIGRIYTELYGNVHADTEFRKKILTMTETGIKRTKSSFKTICILAAAVLLITSGGIIVSATRGVYDTVVVNGEEKKARYGDFGNGTRIWGYEDGNTMYTVYVYGDFDTEKDTLHFVDYGEYFLASTNTEPTLNLYKDIDKSENSYIKEENAMIHCIFNEPELSDEQKEMVEELKDKIMKASLDAYIPMEFLPKAVKSPVESIKFPTLVKNQIKCIDKSAIPQEVVEAPDLAKYNKDKLKGLCKPCFIESEEDRLKMQEVERRIDAMADERIANMLRLILGISKDMTQEEKERIIDDYLSLITYRGDKDGNGSNS